MNRTDFISLLICVWIAIGVGTFTGGAAADEIVVSPTGNDAASGSARDPVATLQQAQTLARQAIKAGQAVTVILRAGTFRLNTAITFTPEDSGTAQAPVLWQASPGENVIVTGGELLKLRWSPYRDGIFKADVPADFVADQLVVNGASQHMARYPNYDPDQRIMNGYAADCISPQRVARWADPTGGYIHAMHSHLWGDYHYHITGKNPDGTLRYEGGWQNNRQMGMHDTFRYVENIFEELDAPGEWYHDAKSHTLYFYPPKGTDLSTASVESVQLRHLIEFRGSELHPVSYITLHGITFTHTARTFMENREPLLRSDWTIYRGGALLMEGAEHCRIEKCNVEQVGGNAVFFSNYNRNCSVVSCRLSDVGANGVSFVGDPNAVRSPLFEYGQSQSYEAMDKEAGPKTNNFPADCAVEDCLIYRTGYEEKQTAGVEIDMSARITVRHCSIYEVPRAGINIGDGCWGGHVIEFCDVFDTVRETGDHGSFNSWGRDRYWLPGIKDVDALVARHPELPTLDCVEPITIRNNRWRCDHGWDIDLDDGSSNYRIYNNLCLNGGIKNREGYGRVVENNVLVNNSFHPHVWYARSGDVFRKNILFGEYQPVGMEAPWGSEVDNNLLHQPGAETQPAARLQQQSGRDELSLVGDAGFIDAAGGNYCVKDDSPARRLGFVNFPMDQFGVVSPELKAVAQKPQLPTRKMAPVVQQHAIDWLGARIKDVETDGEVSATGLGRARGVLMISVPPDSEAAKAGLRNNDVILKVNSNPVAGSDLATAWSAAANKGQVQLTLWREQKEFELEAQSPSANGRETLSLDRGWRFHLGDIALDSFPGGQGVSIYGSDFTHSDAKTGYTWGAAARGYDDKTWRQVDLPHDWVVEQPFEQDAVKAQGYRPRGIAWYRRVFKLDPSDRGRNIELQFDGVSSHCDVYFNGSPVHHNWCGYTSFYIDITPLARYGDDENTIAVRVDAQDMEGWWYEGGGIYRHTWLVKRSPVHIITDGVYANPVKSAQGKWTIPAEVTLTNTGSSAASALVDIGLFDSAGKRVAGGRSAAVQIVPLDQPVAKVSIPVDSPRLWSVDEPNLYEVRTTVLIGDKPVDTLITQCGFRTIRFDAKQGFFLNDKPLKLQGTCNHQDHAGVGVAVPDSIWEFRIRKLKEMGSNAYRTVHNPPSKELLDLCDRMGMLVMDENRHFNPSPEYMRQLEWLVRRDRNHPSVILWCLFNEEGLERFEEGKEIALYMNAAVKRLDVTRPTTGAQDKGQVDGDGNANPNNAAQSLDVVGINYQVALYDKIRAAYLDKPIVCTEDTSQVMTRGEYSNDPSRSVVGSYDDVFWGWEATSSARNSWAAIAGQPSFAGGFCWTGFAYRGEPSPYGWPSTSSHFGALDLCGFPKTEFYVRQALWVKNRPVLTLVPHWNWAGKEGQRVKVMALTNAQSVALLLNGKLVEEKKVDPFQMVQWEVSYVPGRLEAIAKNDGREVARCFVETTGEPVALRLVPDRKSLLGDGADAMPVTVEAIDKDGRAVPTANLPVQFEISGSGAIIGVGNGDPNSHEPEKFVPPAGKDRAERWSRSLFNGLAQIIVQSTCEAGDFKLTATSDGLLPATTVVQTQPCTPRPAVP
jgi:beta-galactosidase